MLTNHTLMATALQRATPYQVIDELVEVGDLSISTLKRLLDMEPFAGHFPNAPIYPGIFTLEMVIQSVHLYFNHYHQPLKQEVSLGSIQTMRFFSPVFPEDCLLCECTMKKQGKEWIVQAKCSNKGVKTAMVKMIFKKVRHL